MTKPPHTRRVALLGDSLTQGWGNDQNESYGRLLENRLNATSPENASWRFEILNFAVTAYELTQMLDVAREDAPRFQPDAYMLALTELAVGRTWNEHLIRLIQAGGDLKYDFLRDAVRRSGASSSDDSLTLIDKLAPYRMTIVRGILMAMKAHAEGEHVPFIVALVPSVEDGRMSQNRLSEMPGVLAELNIPMLDLQDTFDAFLEREQFRINPSDVHPNTRGHTLLCDKLYGELRARAGLWGALTGVTREAYQEP